VPRASALRCAFCHDDLEAGPWICEGCATSLHRDCRELVGRCPSLGCRARARRVVLYITIDYLLLWLVTFLGAWGSLAFVFSRVTRLMVMRKMSISLPTSALVSLSQFAGSWAGLAVAVGVVACSTLAFVKLRERRAARYGFVVAAALAVGSVPCMFVALGLALVNMAKV